MATTPGTLFDDLLQALTTFKQFLDSTKDTLKPAIVALKSVVPKVGDLLTQLIGLMDKLEIEIKKLAAGNLGTGLETATKFTDAANALLDAAKNLLPNDAATIDQILAVVAVVKALPSLASVTDKIIPLIDAIKLDLTALNQP